MDCSPPGFSVHGILQVRILEWVAISFSRGSSIFPTQGSNPGLPHCRQILYHLSHLGSPFSHCASSDFSQYPEQPEDFLLPPRLEAACLIENDVTAIMRRASALNGLSHLPPPHTCFLPHCTHIRQIESRYSPHTFSTGDHLGNHDSGPHFLPFLKKL